MTIELLEKYHCPEKMIEAIRMQDVSKFFTLYCTYYESKYRESEFQNDLTILREFRNKAIAHNETLDVKITTRHYSDCFPLPKKSTLFLTWPLIRAYRVTAILFHTEEARNGQRTL